MTSRWEAAVALLASAWSVRRIVVLGRQKAKLRKGLLGEQILGKFLEEQLMPHNYQVIHDWSARHK